MVRTRIADLQPWAASAAIAHPRDLSAHLAAERGISRSTASRLLRGLVEAGWLDREGRTRPVYRPGVLREVTRTYALGGLDEQVPWERDFEPCFALAPNVQALAHHAFTELLNNCADHSGGSRVTVSMRQNRTHLHLLVGDDGCGVFDRISQAFGIDDPRLALLELSKGKLTTQPERHTGRGLFFTSKLADVFDLHANAQAFQQRHWQPHAWTAGRALPHRGTSVYVAIALDTPRTLDEVLAAYSLDGTTPGFERTVVPLRLITSEVAGLESRAQARRVASRLQSFRRAEVDFAGVPHVGHGFCDELFRVQAGTLPALDLVPVNMAPAVAAMVGSVRAAA